MSGPPALPFPAAPESDAIHLPEAWLFRDRIFGGYLAAVCGVSAARGRPETVQGLDVAFVAATSAGPARVDVVELNAGSRSTTVRVDLWQRDRVVCQATVWLTTGSAAPATATTGPDPVGPDIDWMRQFFPLAALFDERAVDYPAVPQDFHGGADRLELWAKAAAGTAPAGGDALLTLDLALLDLHLTDLAYQQQGGRDYVVSTSLQATWFRPPPAGGWSRVAATVDRGADRCVTHGTIADGGGTRAAASMRSTVVRRS